MNNPLLNIIRTHKAGTPVGIYSVCSSHPLVLEVAIAQALEDETLLLIESTSNQVDQFGGYSGMTPEKFVLYVTTLAKKVGLPSDRLVLGGDHLGPNVWQKEAAESAMGKAVDQVKAYASAGYIKIHLDASMRCDDDPEDWHLEPAQKLMAHRAAVLCRAVEDVVKKCKNKKPKPVYVIGTEVPVPGGARETISNLSVTTVDHARHTIELTRDAFLNNSLEDAWDRVIALVVQPGVEFDDFSVIDYEREKAQQLTRFIETIPRLVYEAHSTDYQSRIHLRELVEDHFAILKVGPGLTFAFREAVQSLATIEEILASCRKGMFSSGLMEVMDRLMTENPEHWEQHYHKNSVTLAIARRYSYSDRIRYYWPREKVTEAIATLIKNLASNPPPLSLLSQYLPVQYQAVREGAIENEPVQLMKHKIREVLKQYAYATGILKHLSKKE